MKMLTVKEYNGQPFRFIQEKKDGYGISIDEKGVWTRKKDVNVRDKLPHHLKRVLRHLMPGSDVLAELHADGVQATSIPTLLNDGSPRLKITAFADLSLKEWPYNLVLNQLERQGFLIPQTSVVCNPDELMIYDEADCDSLIAEAVERKIEGWILKEAHLRGWYKLKPVKTVDAVVTGVTVSDSITHYGGMKAIQVSLFFPELVEIASVGSGFTADYRHTVDQDSLIGRVAEIKYDSIAANGKLKFPRFVRWRDNEKAANECTGDQLRS